MTDIEWITLNTTAGTGNSAVTFSVPAWTGSTDRSVRLTVAVPGTMLSDTVTVTQKGVVLPPADGQFYIIIRDIVLGDTYLESEIVMRNPDSRGEYAFKYSYDGNTWSEPVDKLPVTEDMLHKVIYLMISDQVGASRNCLLVIHNLKEMEVGGSLKSVFMNDDQPYPVYPDESSGPKPGFLSEVGYTLTDIHNLTADTFINQGNFLDNRSAEPPHFPDRMEASTDGITGPVIIDFKSAFSGSKALTGTVVMPSEIIGSCRATYMFDNITDVSLPTPVLPKTVSGDMYMKEMFCGSTLSVGPAFPTNVGGGLYAQGCFSGCTSLTGAPSLSISVGGDFRTDSMFCGCTALTDAPSITATVGGYFDAEGMFSGCTSLTGAPSLSISAGGYFQAKYMFSGCTSLTDGITLPPRENIKGGYSLCRMYWYCSSLTGASINVLLDGVDDAEYMLAGVAPTGILKVLSGETWTDSRIKNKLRLPSGWTIQRVL